MAHASNNAIITMYSRMHFCIRHHQYFFSSHRVQVVRDIRRLTARRSSSKDREDKTGQKRTGQVGLSKNNQFTNRTVLLFYYRVLVVAYQRTTDFSIRLV